jgi:K+-sensing histidine kinase KdpD
MRISEFSDIITFVAFLLTSLIISRLTASAAENRTKAENYDTALVQLKELSDWLLSTPDNGLTLSRIAQETLRIPALTRHFRKHCQDDWNQTTRCFLMRSIILRLEII